MVDATATVTTTATVVSTTDAASPEVSDTVVQVERRVEVFSGQARATLGHNLYRNFEVAQRQLADALHDRGLRRTNLEVTLTLRTVGEPRDATL